MFSIPFSLFSSSISCFSQCNWSQVFREVYLLHPHPQRLQHISLLLHPQTTFASRRRWAANKITQHVKDYTNANVHKRKLSASDYSFFSFSVIGMQHNVTNYCWRVEIDRETLVIEEERLQGSSPFQSKDFVKRENRWRETSITA